MDGPLRYRQLRNDVNRRTMHRFNPLEEYDDEDFRLRFCLRKDSVSDFVKSLDEDLQRQTRRGMPLTPMRAASANCSRQELSRGYGDSKRQFLDAIENCCTSDYIISCFVTFSARFLLRASRSASRLGLHF